MTNKHHNFKTGLLISFLIILLIACIVIIGKMLFTNKKEPAQQTKVALITDSGDVDDSSYNEYAYKGIKRYCRNNNILYKYYKPADSSVESSLSEVDKAAKDGIELIICPNSNLSETVYQAQDRYPDISFVLIDSEPVNNDGSVTQTSENVMSVLFDEDEMGFLAGYIAIDSGLKNPAVFFNSNSTSDMHYYYGFLQGADYAARAKKSKITITSKNVSSSKEKDIAKYAKKLYKKNTDVIFTCNSETCNTITEQASRYKKYIINAGSNMTSELSCIAFSMTKNISTAVSDCIKLYYTDDFAGGTSTIFNASNDGIGISKNNSSSFKYSKENYNDIYKELSDGTIILISDTTVPTEDLELTNIKIN